VRRCCRPFLEAELARRNCCVVDAELELGDPRGSELEFGIPGGSFSLLSSAIVGQPILQQGARSLFVLGPPILEPLILGPPSSSSASRSSGIELPTGDATFSHRAPRGCPLRRFLGFNAFLGPTRHFPKSSETARPNERAQTRAQRLESPDRLPASANSKFEIRNSVLRLPSGQRAQTRAPRPKPPHRLPAPIIPNSEFPASCFRLRLRLRRDKSHYAVASRIPNCVPCPVYNLPLRRHEWRTARSASTTP